MPVVGVAATEPFRRLPAVFVQEVPEVNAIAFVQASLIGCAKTGNGIINTINILVKIIQFTRINVKVFISGLIAMDIGKAN
jgi:hypothetical protein